ncbi:hypothetical protein E3N88_33536 [Mikania micrantha]|uniref:Uncharacterized protein n=1 Tax=Mikania micrantha TaxID=192012 RepID=A0A5N6MBI9_9ASTR|nr:hypothetical protein E3N88_33536 [Mikania micrantha]
MMNVGGNRARNGVTDCPESRNEENFQSIELLDSSRNYLSIIINNINYLMTFKTMSLTLNVQKDLIRNEVLLAAVGQNLNTTVKGAVYDYDGLNDLNHVMMYVKKSCTGMSRQFRLMVKKSCERTGISPVKEQAQVL